jgi:hypothetical protein
MHQGKGRTCCRVVAACHSSWSTTSITTSTNVVDTCTVGRQSPFNCFTARTTIQVSDLLLAILE